jgi:hypothetical protein
MLFILMKCFSLTINAAETPTKITVSADHDDWICKLNPNEWMDVFQLPIQ